MPNILGSKWENFKTKQPYSLSELYEKIKDADYKTKMRESPLCKLWDESTKLLNRFQVNFIIEI